MNFKGDKPIYLQIADLICDKIVNGEWKQGDRIPSVRELGVALEVNPNTVMRGYEWLSEHEIIFNKRGVGFFVGVDALASIRTDRREQLLNHDLRAIAQRMQQLGITVDEVSAAIATYLQG